VSLFHGQEFIYKDLLSLNLVICGERMCDMKTVNFNTGPEVQKFLIPVFARKWIPLEGF